MSDVTPRRIGAAPMLASLDSAGRRHANGARGPEAASAENASGGGERQSIHGATLAEKATLAATALPWVGEVVRCEALDDRSGIMIVVEGSDWLSRATLAWSIADGTDAPTGFVVGRRGLSQRESERDFMARRERMRDHGEDQ